VLTRIRLLLTAAILSIAPAGAQEGTGAPSQAPVKIQAGAQEVLLDMVVRDKRGRIIRDLKAEEVEVLENGVPQKLRAFRLVEGREETRRLEAGGAGAAAAQEPDALSNLRLITLIFQSLSLDGKRFLREASQDLLKMANEPNLYFSVYAIDQTLHCLQPFTHNYDLVRKQVDAAQMASYQQLSERSAQMMLELQQKAQSALNMTGQQMQQDPAAVAEARVAQMQLDALQFAQTQDRGYFERASLYSLLAIVRAQAKLPGRKMLVYLTESFPVSDPQMPLFRAVISEANRSNVAVYTVDARGLVLTGQNEEGAKLAARVARDSQSQMSNPRSATTKQQMQSVDTMQAGLRANMQANLKELAESTGGFLIADTNDFQAPLRRSLDELRTYYEAAYSPEIKTYDGAFRKIAVRITRPDVIVHTRSGYFALPPTASAAPVLAYEAPLLNSLSQEPLPGAVDHYAAALRFEPRGQQRQYTLAVELPLKGVFLQQDKEKNVVRMHASVLGLLKNEKGEVVSRFAQDYPQQFPLDRLAAVQNGYLTRVYRAVLAPGAYTLETSVCDQSSGLVGAKRQPLVVPPVEQALAISSATLIRRVDAGPKDIDPNDPFIAAEGRITPDFSNTARAGEGRQLSFYVIVYPAAGKMEPVELNLSLYVSGRLLGGGDLPLPAPDAKGRIPYIASIPADNLPAGEYEVRLTARQAGQAAEDRLQVRVIR